MKGKIYELIDRVKMGGQKAYPGILMWILVITFLGTRNPQIGLIFIVVVLNAAQGVRPLRDQMNDMLMSLSILIALWVLITKITILPNLSIFEDIRSSLKLSHMNLGIGASDLFIAVSFYPLIKTFAREEPSKLSPASLCLLTCAYGVFASGTIVASALLIKEIQFKLTYPNYIASWLIYTLFISFCEETIYRGIVQNMLRHLVRKKEMIAVVLTAMVYGLSNYTLGGDMVILTTLSGVFYGFLYSACHQLRYPVILHVFVNTVCFLLFSTPILT